MSNSREMINRLLSVNEWKTNSSQTTNNVFENQKIVGITNLLTAIYNTHLTKDRFDVFSNLLNACNELIQFELINDNLKRQTLLLREQVLTFIEVLKTSTITSTNSSFTAATAIPNLRSMVDGMNQFDRVYNVNYLNENERDRFCIYPYKGKLTQIDYVGHKNNRSLIITLFDTSQNTVDNKKGKAIFVISENGGIYAGNHVPLQTVYLAGTGEVYHPSSFYHSSFMSGKPIAYAGTIKVVKGELHYFDDESGHYKPNHLQNENAIHHFKKLQLVSKNTVCHARINANSSEKIWHEIRSDNQRIESMIDQLIKMRDSLKDNLFLTSSKYKKHVISTLILELQNNLNIGKQISEIINQWGNKVLYMDRDGNRISNSKILSENRCIFFSKDFGNSSSNNLLKKLNNQHSVCKLEMKSDSLIPYSG